MNNRHRFFISAVAASLAATFSAPAAHAAEVYLRAESFTKALPTDAVGTATQDVSMWGYSSCDSTFATCTDPSSPPRTGPIVPNQHSALAASPTAVIFGANANVVLAPPVAGPLAGATRSMRRVGVSHTAVDVSGDGPEASKPVAPPCIAPTPTPRGRVVPWVACSSFSNFTRMTPCSKTGMARFGKRWNGFPRI